jgi:hypothetical protein
MSDASEFALPTVERQVGDQTLTFGKLSPTDRAVMLREYKAAARAELKEDIANAGLSATDGYVEMRTFTDDIWGAQRWIRYLNSFDGQQAVFRKGLEKLGVTGPATDAALAGLFLDTTESIHLACDISCHPFNDPVRQTPGMRQAGIIDGKPVYFADETAAKKEGDETNPTPAPPKGYGT